MDKQRSISLKFDFAPAPKGRPRVGRGRMYTPKKTVESEENIRRVASGQLAEMGFNKPLQIPLMIVIDIYLKRPKSAKNREFPNVRPDLDNYVKTVLDALNELLYDDDKQVVSLVCNKHYCDSDYTLVSAYPR